MKKMTVQRLFLILLGLTAAAFVAQAAESIAAEGKPGSILVYN